MGQRDCGGRAGYRDIARYVKPTATTLGTPWGNPLAKCQVSLPRSPVQQNSTLNGSGSTCEVFVRGATASDPRHRGTDLTVLAIADVPGFAAGTAKTIRHAARASVENRLSDSERWGG